MKNKFIILALTLFSVTMLGNGSAVEPTEVKADTYQWQCQWERYCNAYGYCWTRQYCCHQLCNPYAYGCWWECVWR